MTKCVIDLFHLTTVVKAEKESFLLWHVNNQYAPDAHLPLESNQYRKVIWQRLAVLAELKY
jgi:hypothetical protein